MKDETDIRPFFNLVASLKKELNIPVLRELSTLGMGQKTDAETAILKNRLNRIYLRMCRIQEELSHIDFKKAAKGVSAEDYVFSQIDFSRYREIEASYFEALFAAGCEDFDEDFFTKNFRLEKEAAKKLIADAYKKTDGSYKSQKETSVILSVMRNLETSLENSPLFTIGEIKTELKTILDLADSEKTWGKFLPGAQKLYQLLILSLDGVNITHSDGNEAKLFVSGEGKLSGTFLPAGKPWTKALI